MRLPRDWFELLVAVAAGLALASVVWAHIDCTNVTCAPGALPRLLRERVGFGVVCVCISAAE